MARGTESLSLLNNITVILHGTAIPENIGSTVRAMANTGCERLILSSPRTTDLETARRVAVSAEGILEKARIYPSLKEAAAASGAAFLVGTTRRGRKYQDPAALPAAAPEILRMAAGGGAALLFGPEDRGLTNGELALCRMVVSIPTLGDLGSYNLSHAAAIVLYSLMTASCPAPSLPGKAAAGFSELEGMYGHLEDLLASVGFMAAAHTAHTMQAVRKFMNRAEPTAREVRMVRGVCRKTLWRLRKGERQ
ncbi:MAG: TrmJ/YjtD family RNA methyltransferase [Proteobacteria bacterium]|nr:TrmJ/YjtD family RNA methyltransferase [Pseudomonadota bacterium]